MNKKEQIRREAILQAASEQLDILLGAAWHATLDRKRGQQQLVIKKSGKELYRADAVIEADFKEMHVARHFGKLRENGKIIVVAERIGPKIKELLRSEGIDYVDVDGNCFICNDGGTGNLLFNIEGRKNKEYNKDKFHRPFAKAGLKVTYLFLRAPEFINAPYRTIAAAAGVAFGNLKHILDGLIEEGYVVKKNKSEFMIINYEDLLSAWVRAYGEKLRPGLEIGTFRFLAGKQQSWKEIDLDTDKTCWGGEPAAALWTNYLKPEIFTIYTDETKQDLIRHYKLVPDPGGNIKAYRKFWQGSPGEIKTSAILTYADLVLTRDMRCLETAHLIYEKFIDENVQRA